MLTKKQLDLLEFIQKRVQRDGVPPSFDEMKEALDLRSKSGIHRLITALEERGFIRRLAHRARALEIVRLPESLGGEARHSFTPRVIDGDRPDAPRPANAQPVEVAHAFEVPLMGRIAAGVPIEAIQNETHRIRPPGDLPEGDDHFALEVKGDSMIEAGILDGDLVILKRTDDANTGDIVVALIDEEEATLKRLRKKGASIALEAANPAFETRIFGPDRVRVQGRLVALVRRYD